MRRLWTTEELEILKKEYAEVNTEELAKKLNRGITQIYNRAYVFGLKKAENIGCFKKNRSPNATSFKKGLIPFNKGKKQEEYLSAEALQKIKATQFKKGQISHNSKSDGSVTKRRNHGVLKQHIRISEGVWEPLSAYNWKMKFGEIPKGQIVVRKNLNIEDYSIDNLELISRAENMIRNSIQRYPEEIRTVVQTLGRLKKLIKTKENE